MAIEIDYVPSKTVQAFMQSDAKMRTLMGPVGCIAPETVVLTEYGPIPICCIDRPMRVVSWNEKICQFQLSWCGGAFPKGTDYLYRIVTQAGEFAANGHHLTYADDGNYQQVQSLRQDQFLRLCSDTPELKRTFSGRIMSLTDAPYSTQIDVSYLQRYAESARQCGLQLLEDEGIDLDTVQTLTDAHRSVLCSGKSLLAHMDDRGGRLQSHIHHGLSSALKHIDDWLFPLEHLLLTLASSAAVAPFSHTGALTLPDLLFQRMNDNRLPEQQSSGYYPYNTTSLSNRPIIDISREKVKRSYWDMQVLDTNNYVTADGTIHHNSGKSVGCCFEVIRRASMQEPNANGIRRTRAAVVRETARQLMDTTIKTFLDWFPPGVCGRYMRTTKTYFFKVGDVECEVMFRALDDADDVANLNSLELSFAWFNECRDIHPDIVDAMSKRVGRFPSKKDGGPSWHGMWGDTNPPTMDTWWYYQMEHVDPADGVSPNDNGWDVFKQPSGRSAFGENVHNLPDGYYDTQGRSEEYIRVYIDGEYGLSSAGRPVYKYFRPDYHIARGSLTPILNGYRPIIVGIDLGLTPAAVLGQQDARGRSIILDECVSFDMGIQRFARTMLKPLLNERYSALNVLLIVDPAGTQRAQTDERTAVDILKAEGFRVRPAGTNRISARLNAVDDALMRQVDGDPGFLMDPRCIRLKAAMMGGYRYKKTEEAIEKNNHSHVAEALQYLMMHINTVGGGEFVKPSRREVKSVATVGWT